MFEKLFGRLAENRDKFAEATPFVSLFCLCVYAEGKLAPNIV